MTISEAIERIEKSGVESFDIDASFQRKNGKTRVGYTLWISASRKATCNDLHLLVAVAENQGVPADAANAATQVDTISQRVGELDDKFATT